MKGASEGYNKGEDVFAVGRAPQSHRGWVTSMKRKKKVMEHEWRQ